MTKKQINSAINFIDNKFNSMTIDEVENFMTGDGFHSILEEAIDQAFDNPKEAADWWYSSDPAAGEDYMKIYEHYIMAHGKMWKRLHPESYTSKSLKHRARKALLKAVKYHFKQNPNGSVELNYNEPIPASCEIGTFCYDYKAFKFELNYAISQDVDIISIIFKK